MSTALAALLRRARPELIRVHDGRAEWAIRMAVRRIGPARAALVIAEAAS